MLVWLAGLDALRPAFVSGLPERELLDADGSRHRPDLFAASPDAILVADFKTGRPAADHETQVRRYVGLIRRLPGLADAPAAGFLLYLDRRECRPVEIRS